MSLFDECHGILIWELNQLEELEFYLSENTYSDNKMASTLEGLTPDENSHEQVPVTQWNTQNSLDWGMSVCQKHNLDIFTVDVGRLNNSCGTQLIQLSEWDFCFMLGDQYGPIFHKEFQEIKKEAFTDMQNIHTKNEEGCGVGQSSYIIESINHSQDINNLISNCEKYDSGQDWFNSSMYGSFQENNEDLINHYYPCSENNISPVILSNTSDHSEMNERTELYNLDDKFMDTIEITDLNALLPINESCQNSEKSKLNIKSDKPSPRKGNKSKNKIIKDVYVSEDTAVKVTGKIPGLCNRVRQPKSWEFLMHLLVNKETNPEVVSWEDEDNYMFRLVQKYKIVELWNKKSKFTSHVYNNFARSLRYHYKRGVLVPVPEKQLVYRCGPKAIEYLKRIRIK